MSQTPPEATPPLESPSILVSTKASLGVAEDDSSFDGELLTFINSALSELHQVGVGPALGYTVTSASNPWTDVIGTDARLNMAKSFVHLHVKMLFDPPDIGFVLTSMKDTQERLLVRLMYVVDKPKVTTVDVTIPDAFGEPKQIPLQIHLTQSPTIAEGAVLDGGTA